MQTFRKLALAITCLCLSPDMLIAQDNIGDSAETFYTQCTRSVRGLRMYCLVAHNADFYNCKEFFQEGPDLQACWDYADSQYKSCAKLINAAYDACDALNLE